jgi:adenylate kinase family enzyme
MTEAMPEHYKGNFIYRHIWNNITQRDMNATFVIVGTPGKGKSTLALKICEDIDPTFNVNRICYSVVEMVSLLAKKGDEYLKPGAAVMFDEIVNEQGGYSRTALSKHNQVMNFVIANMRARQIVLIICLPKFTQLDKDIREVGLTGVFQMGYIDRNRKKALTKFKWRQADEMTGMMKDIFARLKDGPNNRKYKVTKIWWGKPSNELEKAYKIKKKSYMEDKVAKWLEMLTDEKGDKKLTHARDIAKKILEQPEKYQTNGKFDYIKILANFEVGDQKARNIVKTAESLA